MNKQLIIVGAKRIGIAVALLVMLHVAQLAVQLRANIATADRLAADTVRYERLTDSEQTILVLGDSLAYGVGTSSPETSYAGLVAKRFPDASIRNKAEIGATTRELSENINSIIDDRYSQIHIFIGGNDIARYGVDLDQLALDFEHIINTAASSADQVYIFTSSDFRNVSIMPAYLSGYFSDRSEFVRSTASSLTAVHENAHYVDVFDVSRQEYKEYEAADGFHLNDKGMAALVEVAFSY